MDDAHELKGTVIENLRVYSAHHRAVDYADSTQELNEITRVQLEQNTRGEINSQTDSIVRLLTLFWTE